jgi:hypothetical protein
MVKVFVKESQSVLRDRQHRAQRNCGQQPLNPKWQAHNAPAARLQQRLSSHAHWRSLAPTKRRCNPALSLAATASFYFGIMGQNMALAARLAPFAEDLPSFAADLLRRRAAIATLRGPRVFLPPTTTTTYAQRRNPSY